MKPIKFAIANVASAIGWAPAYMLPGIALGAASLELPPEMAAHALLMLLLAGLFIILCIWMMRQLFLLISNQLNAALTKLWRRLHLSRFFPPMSAILKHYNPQKIYAQLTRAFYFIVLFSIFIYLSLYVVHIGSENIFINKLFFYIFRSLRGPTGDGIMLNITLLGQSKVLIPVFGALFLWLGWKKQWHTACHIVALALLTILSVEIFKHLIHSARPWGLTQTPKGMSFPSGHAALGTVFFLGSALLLVRAFKRNYRFIIYSVAWLNILAICISRIYLGAHWFTDVIGGLLLGASILLLIVLSYNRRVEKTPLQPWGILGVMLISLTVSYSVFYHNNHDLFKSGYAQVDWPIQQTSLEAWWNQTGKNLPLYRLNRFGLSTQILNLQWQDNLQTIQTTLLQSGWQIPPARDWVTILHRVSDVQSTEHLPLVSPLYLDKEPVLVFIKPMKKKLMVLRLWNPNLLIKNNNTPLWVGTVESIPRTFSWLFNRKQSTEINLNPSLLFRKVPDKYDIKVIKVHNTRQHGHGQSLVLIKPNIF